MLLKHIFSTSSSINWTAITILTLIMAGCTTPTQPNTQQPASIPEKPASTLEQLLAQAKNAQKQTSPRRDIQLLSIVNRLLNIGEQSTAADLFVEINRSSLDDFQFARYAITGSDIYIQQQLLFKAKNLLEDPRLNNQTANLPIEQQRQLHKNRAILYQQVGEVVAALNERIILGTLLSETEEINDNNNAIWQQLNTMTPLDLEILLTQSTNDILKGWFELAITSKSSQSSLAAQNKAILNWVTANPNHPASLQLPADLALLQQMIQSKPQHIALLLPLKGKLAKAGEAIRDGFMASHYSNYPHNTDDTPTIQFYDTSEEDIISVYDKAVANGASMIVGPLKKERVQRLSQHPNLSITTLALNYSPESNNMSQPLYQFGLSLEDESIQVADRAWLEGHRQAMVISSKAGWSQRATNAFIERWQNYGGTIILNSQLNEAESYSDTIKDILHIDQSKQRATELKRLFGRSFEFEPRRRNDIDMIFLVARSKEGRQIKPTLNFHYAGNIPVYATSQIFSSANNKEKNIDLNNIRLTTLPWTINDYIKEKQLINNSLKVGPGYERLYALGVDSFLLYPRLQQLYTLSEQQLYGATGKLSINTEKRIIRQQVWAEIKNGELRPLRTLTLSNDNTL